MSEAESRTRHAIGTELFDSLAQKHFCIVGCGGVGAAFAEMLVRTGVRKLTLIDGGRLEEGNLNRCGAYTYNDLEGGKERKKAELLREHLERMSSKRLKIEVIGEHHVSKGSRQPNKPAMDKAEEAVYHPSTDVVVIAADDNRARLAIEENAKGKDFLSIGVWIDRQAGTFGFECSWQMTTPLREADAGGYGPGNASYAALVMEATSAGFHILLSQVQGGAQKCNQVAKHYSGDFVPVRHEVNGVSMCIPPQPTAGR